MFQISKEQTSQKNKEKHCFYESCTVKKNFTAHVGNKFVLVKKGTKSIEYEHLNFYFKVKRKKISVNICDIDANPDYFKVTLSIKDFKKFRGTNYDLGKLLGKKVKCIPNYALPPIASNPTEHRYFQDGKVTEINEELNLVKIEGLAYHQAEIFVLK